MVDNGQKHAGMVLLHRHLEQQVVDGLRSLDHLQTHMSEYKSMLSREDKQSIIDALNVITTILPVWYK